jgi:hypothetical protein
MHQSNARKAHKVQDKNPNKNPYKIMTASVTSN